MRLVHAPQIDPAPAAGSEDAGRPPHGAGNPEVARQQIAGSPGNQA